MASVFSVLLNGGIFYARVDPRIILRNVVATPGKPTLADLVDGRHYVLLDRIEHASIQQWLQKWIFRLGLITGPYWFVNVLAFGLVARIWKHSGLRLVEGFPIVCLGFMAGFLVLLPVHEHLHGLAYRAFGARQIQVRYDLRRLTALCIAPGEVLTGGKFAVVALAPLAVLQPALVLGVWMMPGGTPSLMMAGACLLHLGACSGDVAFVEYVWSNRGRGLVTFDDPASPVTYFYRRPESGESPASL
jgi:hypothetical protein